MFDNWRFCIFLTCFFAITDHFLHTTERPIIYPQGYAYHCLRTNGVNHSKSKEKNHWLYQVHTYFEGKHTHIKEKLVKVLIEEQPITNKSFLRLTEVKKTSLWGSTMCPVCSLIPSREQLKIKNLLKGFQALEYIFYMVSHLDNPLSISFFIIFT